MHEVRGSGQRIEMRVEKKKSSIGRDSMLAGEGDARELRYREDAALSQHWPRRRKEERLEVDFFAVLDEEDLNQDLDLS